MRFEVKKLDELVKADYNPRIELKEEDPQAYEKLKRSIEHYGLVEPIVLNERTGNIVGGHQRLEVLKDLEWEEVKVSVVDLSEEQEKILNVGLNNISGEWNIEQLKDILLEIDTGEVDVELTGFDLSEIEDMMTRTYQEFEHEEIDLDNFDDDNFHYCCPDCGFYFNK